MDGGGAQSERSQERTGRPEGICSGSWKGRDQYEMKAVKAAGPSAFMNVGSESE